MASDGLKLQRITPPGIAICQKLDDSENICVWPYEKGIDAVKLQWVTRVGILIQK